MMVSWEAVKNFVDSRSLSIGWTEDTDNYYIFASESGINVETILHKSNLNDALSDFEQNYKPKGNITRPEVISPFASKFLGTKKLFKRIYGVRETLTTGSNEFIWTCPVSFAKTNGMEVIGGEIGDYCSVYVLDTVAGTVTGTPSAVIDQYGFDANIAKDFCAQKSEFDADVFFGIQFKVVYHSISNKTVGVNFILNEVADA